MPKPVAIERAPSPDVIEPRVIPVDPFDALEQHGSPVPLLLGSNREEFTSVGDNPTVPLDENGYAAAIHARFDPFGPSVADHVLSLYPLRHMMCPYMRSSMWTAIL